MGNLLFDQTVWPTLRSLLLRVDLRDGRPVDALVDPLLIEDFQPVPAFGSAADTELRQVAGAGPLSGFDLSGFWQRGGGPATQPVTRHLRAAQVGRLASGWWAHSGAHVRVGSDLLWTGGFEDDDGGASNPTDRFWDLGGHGALTPAASCHGRFGVRLTDPPSSTGSAVLTPDHRQLVRPGTRLGLLLGSARSHGAVWAELHWYRGRAGSGESVTRVRIPAHGPRCSSVRLYATAPRGDVAVSPYIRTAPGAAVDVDDVRLVQFGQAGRRSDTVVARRDTDVVLERDDPSSGRRPFLYVDEAP
jgi:hypothetical protein